MPWIPVPWYWIPDSLSVEPGFRMPIVNGISDSLTCIPDSKAKDLEFTSKNFPDSGFHEQKFPGFRIPQAKFPGFHITQAKFSRIPDFTTKNFLGGYRNPDSLTWSDQIKVLLG